MISTAAAEQSPLETVVHPIAIHHNIRCLYAICIGTMCQGADSTSPTSVSVSYYSFFSVLSHGVQSSWISILSFAVRCSDNYFTWSILCLSYRLSSLENGNAPEGVKRTLIASKCPHTVAG